jgi:hypothetical protein
MIHTTKDGRKWAPISFETGTHLVGRGGSLSKECRSGAGQPIILPVSYCEMNSERDYQQPGDGRPLCPACCRAAIALGLLEEKP